MNSIRCSIAAIALVLVAISSVNASAAGEPTLMIQLQLYGSWDFTGTEGPPAATSVAPGQELQFSWSAVVGNCATIMDYRYAWDLLDPNDDSDPAWSAWGSETSAPPISFMVGIHTFTVEVRDTCGQLTRGVVQLTVEEPPVSTEVSTWGAIKSLFR